MKNTRLAGHTLKSEGIPNFYSRNCVRPSCRNWQAEVQAFGHEELDRDHSQWGSGHARCSCGAESEHLSSQSARRRWHAAHKTEIRNRTDSPKGD